MPSGTTSARVRPRHHLCRVEIHDARTASRAHPDLGRRQRSPAVAAAPRLRLRAPDQVAPDADTGADRRTGEVVRPPESGPGQETSNLDAESQTPELPDRLAPDSGLGSRQREPAKSQEAADRRGRCMPAATGQHAIPGQPRSRLSRQGWSAGQFRQWAALGVAVLRARLGGFLKSSVNVLLHAGLCPRPGVLMPRGDQYSCANAGSIRACACSSDHVPTSCSVIETAWTPGCRLQARKRIGRRDARTCPFNVACAHGHATNRVPAARRALHAQAALVRRGLQSISVWTHIDEWAIGSEQRCGW